MSLIHPSGSECLTSSLELFTVPKTLTTIEKTYFTRIHPVTSLDKNGPIEFAISLSEEYLDLSNVYLLTTNRILDADNQPIPATFKKKQDADEEFNEDGVVFPINLFHSTRFKSVECFINGVQISDTDTLYGYRSYMEYILSYGRGAKENMGQMLIYAKDNYPIDANFAQMEVAAENKLHEGVNFGAWKRWQKTKFSQPFEMAGKIHSELFCQERFLPNNCQD